MKGTIGNPRYKIGDEVEFELEVSGIPFRLKGEIFIVDAYGTFGQNEEPSYDIMVEKLPLRDEGAVLVKHIRESSIGGREDMEIVCEAIKDMEVGQITSVRPFCREFYPFEMVCIEDTLTYKYENLNDVVLDKTITKDNEIEVVSCMIDIYRHNGLSTDKACDLAFADKDYLAWKPTIIVEE